MFMVLCYLGHVESYFSHARFEYLTGVHTNMMGQTGQPVTCVVLRDYPSA